MTTIRGSLINCGKKRIGLNDYNFSKCVDCDTQYPDLGKGVSCNAIIIPLCPWCRVDSTPDMHGRGA